MSLHAVLVVGRYQESGQDRAVLASAWETEIKVTLGRYRGRHSADSHSEGSLKESGHLSTSTSCLAQQKSQCLYSTCAQDQTR